MISPSSSSCPSLGSSAAEETGLRVVAHSDPEDFERLAPEWRRLLARCEPRHPFYDPAWHSAWWKNFGSGTLLLCAVRRRDDSLLAVAPWMRKGDGTLRFIGGEDVTDYLDIVAAKGANPAAWKALISFLEGPEAPDWKRLDLHCVPADSPTVPSLCGSEGPAGGRAKQETEDVCPVIPLPGTWTEYLEMIGPREAKELRRKIRKTRMEAGLEFHRTRTAGELDKDLEDFFRLHALSHPEKERFWTAGRKAFFGDLARAMLALGWLDLTFLRVDGHAAGANFSFIYENRVYLYNSGYDPAERELSAGVVLLARNIRTAIEEGRWAFDLLRGEEPYKYRLGGKDEKILRISLDRLNQ